MRHGAWGMGMSTWLGHALQATICRHRLPGSRDSDVQELHLVIWRHIVYSIDR